MTYPFNFISYKKPYVHGKLLGSITGSVIVIFRRWLEFLLAFYPPYNWVSYLAVYRIFIFASISVYHRVVNLSPFFSAKITILVGEVSDTNNHITGKYSCITFLYWVSVGLF